ncbi:unnamed protein product [Rotaria sordida]|uniref:G-protein coupled receptors family 1 profile domain-containing protein n=1 Tax=Rotaria sordida TaxID=392033 RepID=A0A815HFG0_9BILA|nr:unnamed protein product [Rotaria sordida]CAF1602138.1 unnamed protein product [Rotaria sordida]
MSAISDNESLIILLESISTQCNRYATLIIFLFGVVRNILNILVLTRRSFRSNSCAWIFLTLSIVNLISILFGLTTRIINGWTTVPTDYIGWACKLRAFVVFSTRTIASWLIVLATVDRWLLSSTNVHRRQKSTLKNAQRWTTTIVILSILLYAQQLYCYEANLIDTPLKCYGKTDACRLITDSSFAVITILFPLVLMILFGLLTISNVRQSQRRIHQLQLRNMTLTKKNSAASNNENPDSKSKWKTNHSLLRMLFFQVLLLTIFTLPLSLEKFYSTFSEGNGSSVQKAINNFVYEVAALSYFISNGIPFYIYTLCGGTIFRKALYDFFMLMKRKMMHR